MLPTVGASLPTRDPVDTRLIADVAQYTPAKSSTPKPRSAAGQTSRPEKAPLDSDNDGIPDAWEIKHHLNPTDPSDALHTNKDGYTNLEKYLNEVADRKR